MTKRNFQEIRDLILLTLSGNRKTINQLAQESGINWKTTQHHLVYLIGKQMVKEVFSSPYVRIFELTDNGDDYISIRKTPQNAFVLPEDSTRTFTIKVTR